MHQGNKKRPRGRAVSAPGFGSRGRIPLEARFLPNLNGASLHRTFHVHPSITSKLLKYCWKGSKTLTNPSMQRQQFLPLVAIIGAVPKGNYTRGKESCTSGNNCSTLCILLHIRYNFVYPLYTVVRAKAHKTLNLLLLFGVEARKNEILNLY